jgi:hypothetical protein
MIYWAKRRCSPGAEIPFMKVLGDLQLKLGAPHELMMLVHKLPPKKPQG